MGLQRRLSFPGDGEQRELDFNLNEMKPDFKSKEYPEDTLADFEEYLFVSEDASPGLSKDSRRLMRQNLYASGATNSHYITE